MSISEIYERFLKCSSVCTDTRKISDSCMFFALKGGNFNGNSFSQEALKKGAAYCIIDEAEHVINENCILVDDVLSTLQELSTYHRKQIDIPIIALTGSNGKTTTKELINAVLETTYNTKATDGNFNNHIGLPLTLLSFNKDTEIGIVEMGANHQKEIEFLSNLALPDYGLITNFGKAHLEGFGGFEGVIKGKSELYLHLKAHNKVAFINSDDELQEIQIGNYTNVYSFGSGEKNNVIVNQISNDEFVSARFGDIEIHSNLTGNYNYNNIAVAIAIGNYFKVSKESIKKGIESYVPKNNRSQIIENDTNKIILDAYNANPSSIIAAIDNFKIIENDNKIVFLGDMFELGESSTAEHQSIMSYAETKIEGKHIFIGENFYNSKTINTSSLKFQSFDDCIKFLKNLEVKNSLILIKGSRGMALERILPFLE